MFTWAARKMPVTPKKTGLLALLEFGLVWVRDEVVYAWLGPEEGRRYLPLMWTIFFFILFSNLFGLFPFTVVPDHRTDGLSVATGNLAVTGALAFIVFVVVLAAGHAQARRRSGTGPRSSRPACRGRSSRSSSCSSSSGCSPGRSPWRSVSSPTCSPATRCWASCSASSSGSTCSRTRGRRSCRPSGRVFFLIGILLFEVLIALIQAYIFTILSVIFVSISVADEH